VLNWYALYIKSRHEFVTNSELTKKGIETFLPVVRKRRQWKDRKKQIDFPLFPGYLFVHIKPRPEDFLTVMKARGTVTLLSAEPGCPTAIPSVEITSLRLLVESGKPIDIYPHLREGTRVIVRKGPLEGAEGTLKTKDDHCMFLVNVELLGRSIGVKIHAEDIETI